ncbi:MAG: ErfK/YbiS/YcfS/YnhG family protein [Acidobacteriaceae bacterium]|nr:ErfK/YbiS/YcfS/YnhG family protein [Acidobacteriaceae bacterium]
MVPPRMMRYSVRKVGSTVVLAALMLAAGCKKHRKTTSVENTTDYAGNLQTLVATKKLPSLRWPNFSDYQPSVTQFYNDRNFEVAWTRDGRPTAQATAFMEAFKTADAKGLIPEDYDASLWAARVAKLDKKNADAISEFDVAMTVNSMRYISDLRIGRVNPSHFNFDINVQSKKYDLAEFVSDHAVDSTNVPKLIASVEPDSEQYRKSEEALAHYLELAKQQEQNPSEELPAVTKTVGQGDRYVAVPALVERLKIEGDLPGDATAEEGAKILDEATIEGLKNYQHRHGMVEDGRLGAQTVMSLNVPMAARVTQLESSLERWRWLPNEYINAPLMVNLPEFMLHAYDAEHQPAFTMKVVVGKVVGEHQTPVFAHMMKYLVFRPFWNVPVSIIKKELVPHIAQSGIGYLASKNFEVTNNKGDVLTGYTAQQVAQGGVMVREKPGPKNSLGLVKFMFPNQYNIYLHSTPQPYLFDRSRRDFSHGCVRVQKPEDLAVWVLQNQKNKDGSDWDLEKVHEAMTDGPDNKTVSLKTPIPIVIFYLTGLVEEDGHVHFFDDVYGYDADLQKVLQKGPPYPVKPEPVVPKTEVSDTV